MTFWMQRHARSITERARAAQRRGALARRRGWARAPRASRRSAARGSRPWSSRSRSSSRLARRRATPVHVEVAAAWARCCGLAVALVIACGSTGSAHGSTCGALLPGPRRSCSWSSPRGCSPTPSRTSSSSAGCRVGEHVLWNTSRVVSEASSLGDVFHSLLGYADRPDGAPGRWSGSPTSRSA